LHIFSKKIYIDVKNHTLTIAMHITIVISTIYQAVLANTCKLLCIKK